MHKQKDAMHRHHAILVSLAALPLVAAAALALADAPSAPARSGIDLTGMDPSVKPYEDFYQFANGKWLARADIPPDRPAVYVFTLLDDRNRETLRKILEDIRLTPQAFLKLL